MASPHGITNVILRELFPVICPLETYLEEHLGPSLGLVDSKDPEEFKHLVTTTLVGINPASNKPNPNKPELDKYRVAPTELVLNESMDLEDVIERALRMTAAQRKVVENVFSGGYLKSNDQPWIPGDPIEKFQHNPNVEYIRSPPWSTLLNRVGEDMMLHLFTSTSLFRALANSNFIQLTGIPLSDMSGFRGTASRKVFLPPRSDPKKRPASTLDQEPASDNTVSISPNVHTSTNDVQRPSKRRKIESKKRKRLHKQNESQKRKRPNEEVENKEQSSRDVENKAQSSKDVESKEQSSKDVENKEQPNKDGNKKKTKDQLPYITTSRSRVFYYRQVHTDTGILRNSLISSTEFSPSPHGQSASTSKPPQSLSNVDELMKYMFPKQYPSQPPNSKLQHPWRLRKMRDLVENMLRLNNQCQYMILLRYYCPIEVIDMLRHTPEEYKNIPLKHLPVCGTSFEEVTSYVHAVVKKVIPLEMFGSVENRTIILRAMTRFIRLRKYENMSLQYMIQGFKTSQCEWLKDSRLGQNQHRVRHTPPSASKKQKEIANEFATFYVTETSHQRNKISYYRHDLWKLLTAPAIETLKANMFRRMDQREVMMCRRMYAGLRLLPKKSQGLRPIINLSRKSPRLVNGSSVWRMTTMNKQLEDPHLVLSCELEPQSFATSSSSPGMNELYGRIKAVREKLVDLSSSDLPKLFMVKLDIQKCFDSVKQDKVLEVMQEALKDNHYIIKKGTKVFLSNGKIIAKPLSKATRSNGGRSFMDIADQHADSSCHAIFTDKIIHHDRSRKEVIDMVKSHITGNIIQLGKHFYRQFTGIPQGSVLSPALCRLYYDDMEDNLLADLTKGDDSALLRLADDFLFISRNKSKAIAFLERMSGGLSEYNCTINKEKTIINFPYVLRDGTNVTTREDGEFPYCGLLLHTRTLEIRTDYSRYHEGEIRNTLTISRARRGGKSIVLKMKSGMQFPCKMMFSDTSFNSWSRVMLNIYQNLYFCAMKLHAYCQELHLDPTTRHLLHPSALPSIVDEIFDACYGLLKNGCRSAVGVKVGARFGVPRDHLVWLGANAFCLALPKTSFYRPLRTHLQKKILNNKPKSNYFRRVMMSAVRDPRNKIMDDITYQLPSTLVSPPASSMSSKPKSDAY
ncbi:hypothetical protein BGX34_007274 [Mortierella sp. NVP85]|nr:hypothetical protein BGX34_007274 [Mortierella sp. NVP85]